MRWGDLICRQVRCFGPLVIGIDPSFDEMPECLPPSLVPLGTMSRCCSKPGRTARASPSSSARIPRRSALPALPRSCRGVRGGRNLCRRSRAVAHTDATLSHLAPGLGVQRGDGRARAALARPHSPVIVSVSRGIAATTARTMCLEDYRALLVSRIEWFAAQLTGAGRPEPGEGASLPLALDPLSTVAR
jgi:hypothetical protein